MGPAVGGMFLALGPGAPFWAAAGFSLINAAYGFFVVPESLNRERRAPFQFKLASFNAVGVLRSKPGLLTLAMILVLLQFAIMVFPTAFVLYAFDRYHWGTTQITACMTSFGVCSFAVQAGLSGRLVRKLGEPMVIMIGMLCAVLATAIFGLAPNGLIFWIGIPIMTLSGIAGPAVQSIMTRRVSAGEQGKLQGANTSLQAVAGIIAPVLFGEIYTLALASGGSAVVLGAPFLLASLFLVIGVVLALQVLRRTTVRV